MRRKSGRCAEMHNSTEKNLTGAMKKYFSIQSIWKPRFIRNWAQIVTEEGIRGLIKRKGMVFLIAFITFYAIRDTLIYIVIPFLVLKGIITCK